MVVPREPALPQALPASSAALLYGRTATRLVDDLVAGGFRPGDRLPSERVLSEHYRVSRSTLRAALTQLAEQGVITPSPARGWFLTDLTAGDGRTQQPGDGRPSGHVVQGFADYAAEHGLATHAMVLESGVRPCVVAESEMLRIAPGAELFEMRRLRYLNDLVVVLEHNLLPLAICPALATTDFTTASLYATLRAAKPPQLPRLAQYTVEARQPIEEERRLLEVDNTVPMLVATQLSFNQDGAPIEFTVQVYRGDRYRFRGSITD
ncbi:GntR family transcriptional regulator [Asanoa ishikariensis]|uniref:GntR family transcriptional regulator n=2 Tax=Asanoa ishikariensis TaxID=137265 RepID=A0A1H3UD32_9ACTN|nr:GntR family transcriptional regulator [Asanoa ishikariensis]SDZ59559.1 GntR family transcriptional regulator [Asanoa ishikariensis]